MRFFTCLLVNVTNAQPEKTYLIHISVELHIRYIYQLNETHFDIKILSSIYNLYIKVKLITRNIYLCWLPGHLSERWPPRPDRICQTFAGCPGEEVGEKCPKEKEEQRAQKSESDQKYSPLPPSSCKPSRWTASSLN